FVRKDIGEWLRWPRKKIRFVRKDIGEWLRWPRKKIRYDGWRLGYVLGFWGGYVKEYMEAIEPIIDTNRTAGAFDVTTKGILHYVSIHNKFSYDFGSVIIFYPKCGGGRMNLEARYRNNFRAKDNLVFLHKWFLKFPQYQQRDLFITGESYA
nr:alpha-amylase 3, chloroplastic [Tanacetum cinerariifolium]